MIKIKAVIFLNDGKIDEVHYFQSGSISAGFRALEHRLSDGEARDDWGRVEIEFTNDSIGVDLSR